jgi:hypothetical protein
MPAFYVGPNRVYALTEEDKLWLARAIAGECGESPKSLDGPACVCWAMINRFLLSPAQANWKTLTELLRAFCQPINPKWARGGSICANPSPKEAKYCTENLYQRREHIATLPWEKINQGIRDTVTAFAKGSVFLPNKVLELAHWRLSNWAAYRVKQPLGYEDVNVGDNWFFEDARLLPCEVHVAHADTAPAPQCYPTSKGVGGGWTTLNTLGVVLALGVAGIAGYLAWAQTHY